MWPKLIFMLYKPRQVIISLQKFRKYYPHEHSPSSLVEHKLQITKIVGVTSA